MKTHEIWTLTLVIAIIGLAIVINLSSINLQLEALNKWKQIEYIQNGGKL